MSQSPPDPRAPQPGDPQHPGEPAPGPQTPGQQAAPQQPAPEQPGAQQYLPQPYPAQPSWGQAGAFPQAPDWTAHPPYGSRFDPADPLISDDYNGWWRRSFGVIRSGWRQLALLQLLILVPVLAVLIPTQVSYERRQRAAQAALETTTPGEMPDFWALLAPSVMLFGAALVAGLVYGVGMLAAVRLVAVIATGGRPRIGDALLVTLRRIPAAIGWYIVAAAIAVAAVLACLLPVIYVSAVFMILPAVVVFERGNAISRCFRLFHADLGSSVGRVATVAGLNIAASLILGALTLVVSLVVLGSGGFDATADVSSGGTTTVGVLTALLNGLYYFVSGIVMPPLLVAAYADMRARHEPFASASLVTSG